MNCLPLCAVCALATLTAPAFSQTAPTPLQTVARFPGATPIGVTVSRTGRIFMSFPRAFDVGPYDVAEIKNGRPERKGEQIRKGEPCVRPSSSVFALPFRANSIQNCTSRRSL